MLSNSLTEFAFHQPALTGNVIPGAAFEQYLRNLESMSRQVQKAQHFRFLSALRSVRNDMCTRHARHVAYLLFIE